MRTGAWSFATTSNLDSRVIPGRHRQSLYSPCSPDLLLDTDPTADLDLVHRGYKDWSIGAWHQRLNTTIEARNCCLWLFDPDTTWMYSIQIHSSRYGPYWKPTSCLIAGNIWQGHLLYLKPVRTLFMKQHLHPIKRTWTNRQKAMDSI